MIRLQMRALHQKRSLGLDLAILQRRRLGIADQVIAPRPEVGPTSTELPLNWAPDLRSPVHEIMTR